MVKVRGERRWTAVPAYALRASSPEELAELFNRAKHEIAQSADPALGPWDRFRAASRASESLATLVLRASGYETVPAEDPQGALDALPVLFGAEGRGPAAAFLACHRKSRRRSCPWKPTDLEREFGHLVGEVEKFRTAVLEWLESTRKPLIPPGPKSPSSTKPHQGTLF